MFHAGPPPLDPDATAPPTAAGAASLTALPDAANGSIRGQRTWARAVRSASGGRVALAATMIVLGIMGVVGGDFTPIWLPVPRGVPARAGLVYLTGLGSLGCGLGLLWRRAAAIASGVLFGLLLAWLVLVNAPLLVLHPGMELVWAAAETAALVAAAWVLYVRFADLRAGARRRLFAAKAGLRTARALYGLSLVPFGIAHFTYFARTVAMVPAWLPWHPMWAAFFGCTFMAAGGAVLFGIQAPLAAALSAVQLGMFTLLVWVPVLVTGASASDWHEFVVSWTLTAAAWVVADSYRAGAGPTEAR